IPSSDNFKGKEIFDYLSDAGYRVGVVNMPTTYPPHKINGVMVSGGPDAMESKYTYPEPLEKLLKNKFDYRALPQNISLMKKDETSVIDEIYRLIKVRFEVAEYLLKEGNFDFFMVAVYLINVLQHYHYGDDKVFKAWQIIDEGINSLITKYPDRLFFLMSDHGTNEIKFKFNINTYLQEKGYLKIKQDNTSSKLEKIGINRESLIKLFTKLHLKELAKKLVPRKVQEMIPNKEGQVMYAGKADKIDWDNSKCFASGQGPIYLLSKDLEFKNKLIRELEELEYKGMSIVNKVFTREEIYKSSDLSKAPDLIVDQAPHTHFSGSLGSKHVFEAPDHWTGENEKKGIFLAYGEGVLNSKKDINILDYAPTILNHFNVEVLHDMDGEVIGL
ncbi:hypothetical protein HOG11_04190, partial [bacterium]|nr:hypothetical protein [bacterium]